MKSRTRDEVSHVVIWIGHLGDVPLVIDGTGDGRTDSNGIEIPDGVQLRPFTDRSWYFQSASHALRLIADGK